MENNLRTEKRRESRGRKETSRRTSVGQVRGERLDHAKLSKLYLLKENSIDEVGRRYMGKRHLVRGKDTTQKTESSATQPAPKGEH